MHNTLVKDGGLIAGENSDHVHNKHNKRLASRASGEPAPAWRPGSQGGPTEGSDGEDPHVRFKQASAHKPGTHASLHPRQDLGIGNINNTTDIQIPLIHG